MSYSPAFPVAVPRTAVTHRGGLRFPRWLIGAAISAATIIALDLMLGLFCRDGQFRQWRLPPYPLLFTENQAKWLQADAWPYYRFDAELGWTLRPAAVFGDGQYRTNSAGIRSDREYDVVPPAGVTRAAVFGDSFVHGDEVHNQETAWALLEGSPEREVLNFGVPGYGTDQAYLRYQHEAARVRPDIVVVGFMLENIQRNVSVFRPAYYHDTGLPLAKPRFRIDAAGGLELLPCPAGSLAELRELIETRRLVSTLVETDYWVRQAPMAYTGSIFFQSSLGRIAYAAHAGRGRSHTDYYRDTASEPFQVTAAILEALCKTALTDGAKRAVVLLLPDKNTIREQTPANAPHYWRSLIDHLQARGVECIDFASTLLEAARRDGIDEYFVNTHYSPRGHAELARFLDPILFPVRD